MSEPGTLGAAAAALADRIERGPLVRAVNFHNTPRARAAEYERQVREWSRRFSSVNEDELDVYLATGRWMKSKPGLIVVMYEGYRNGYDVMLPLLDRYGLTGWFFVITGFVKAPPGEQFAFASGHDIDMETREYRDGRYAMTWEELRDVGRRHVIASHTRSHISLAPLGPAERESEVLGAQRDLEEHLGRKARAFASLGGPAYGEDAATDRLIDAAGYQFVFSNLRIQRLRSWDRS